MRYFVCHTRGPNFDLLKKRGFITFYPTIDDYVFLPDKPENISLLRKQSELGVMFLRANNEYVSISEEEMNAMLSTTLGKIKEGSEITAIEGIYEGLDGVVSKIEGDLLTCTFKGLRRIFEARVPTTQIVLKGEAIGLKKEGDDLFLDTGI